MKALILSTIFAFFLVSCREESTMSKSADVKPRTDQVKITGSDTELPLTEKEIEIFSKKDTSASISLTGGGSSVGITAFIEGRTDIAMASRELSEEEKNTIQQSGMAVKQEVIAYDALAIVVNPDNTVENLTREQIESIYTGESTSWSSFAGSDGPISAIARENSSGSYAFFKERVLKGKNYSSTILNMPSNGQILESISKSPNAIGYISLAYVNKNVKVLGISYDGGKNFYPATIENVKNKSYPIARPLYYIYSANAEIKVNNFIRFVLSEQGQKIVQEEGFVPVK